MKQKTAIRLQRPDLGDIWSWIALDADSKLVPFFTMGDRSAWMAREFVENLSARCANRIQLTSDGLRHYQDAVERAFGADVDYGQCVKTYTEGEASEGGSDGKSTARRYSPPRVVECRKTPLMGSPDKDLISTSYVEKQNHTLRMHVRRLSRLTNAFSKKRANFEAAVSLHFAYYNLVKTHGTVRCTPAMAAGVTETHWTVADLVEMIEG